MRKLLVGCLIVLGVFASPSRGRAAALDITVSLHDPATWYLEVSSLGGAQVGAIALVVSDSLGAFTQFLPPVGDPPICVLVVGGCEPLPPVAPPGFHAFQFVYGAAPGGFPLLPFSGLIGAFAYAAPGAPVEVLPGDSLFGATAFDTNGAVILDVAIHVVPEPGVTGLALLALLGVTSLRRTHSRSATRT
jgi:hypothetical protein